MTFSALYLLPALALLILIQGYRKSARGNLKYRSRKHQQNAHHRVLFFRLLVVALVLATALTKAWPLPNLLDIVQGVMITVAIMIPFCVYIIINRLWPQQPSERYRSGVNSSGPVDVPDLRPAPAHLLADRIKTSRSGRGQRQPEKPDEPSELPGEPQHESLQNSLDELLNELPKSGQSVPAADPMDDAAWPASQTAEKNAAISLASGPAEQESALDQTLSVGEQLETLNDLVDFHDIGADEHPVHTAASDAPPAYNPLEKAIAVAREAIMEEPGMQDYSTENLPAKSRVELSEMVVRLRSDKMKLQKLVIAQKAVIDSEKQAHERTRVVVKDAISVMRHARHGQRIAEKIARRERAERQRLEKDYVKVRRALDNALSTLRTKSERVDVEEA